MAIKKSNEGGRVVSLGGEGGAAMGDEEPREKPKFVASHREGSLGKEPMRMEPDAGPAAANDESVQHMIAMAADSIARAHPSFQTRKTSVEAKLKAAIEGI